MKSPVERLVDEFLGSSRHSFRNMPREDKIAIATHLLRHLGLKDNDYKEALEYLWKIV